MLINLAYILSKPTGTTAYALNLLPHLNLLNPTYLATLNSGLDNYYPVPANMTAEYGMAGHMRRLLWTQFQLPKQYHQLKANFLFSPITEAPLWSGCRFVVTVHDLTPLRFPQYFSSLKWLYRYYTPRVLAQAAHIICNSEATAADIVQFYGVSAAKITPILLAYDADHFKPVAASPQNYFLVLGRHVPYKNVSGAIAAFAKLPKAKQYELWIAGPIDPRYTPLLKQQVVECHLQTQVRFLDYVPYEDLPLLLSQAIALVFPSLWEGFGLPVLEAMACGTPVISSNLSSLPEVAGDAAILVDPYDRNAITVAMQSVANNGQLRQKLRTAGLERAKLFTWQRTGQQTVEVLKQFL
ncbi:MAG: glycosyltransferase family 1 protein [Leptolyngbyaceae cyanobacterium MO_188.B28]|nr:glycosyltransferase family 1 protein [Leptolyngbyaceae cyanobacterium MO_188.B28]